MVGYAKGCLEKWKCDVSLMKGDSSVKVSQINQSSLQNQEKEYSTIASQLEKKDLTIVGLVEKLEASEQLNISLKKENDRLHEQERVLKRLLTQWQEKCENLTSQLSMGNNPDIFNSIQEEKEYWKKEYETLKLQLDSV